MIVQWMHELLITTLTGACYKHAYKCTHPCMIELSFHRIQSYTSIARIAWKVRWSLLYNIIVRIIIQLKKKAQLFGAKVSCVVCWSSKQRAYHMDYTLENSCIPSPMLYIYAICVLYLLYSTRCGIVKWTATLIAHITRQMLTASWGRAWAS